MAEPFKKRYLSDSLIIPVIQHRIIDYYEHWKKQKK